MHAVNVIAMYPQSPGSLLQGRGGPLCFLHPAAWQEGYNQEENRHQEERPQPRIQRKARKTKKTLTLVKKRWKRFNWLFLPLHRFDFEFSLEESIQRRLDLSVKNSVSFMSRERELIGKVQYKSSLVSEIQLSVAQGHKNALGLIVNNHKSQEFEKRER